MPETDLSARWDLSTIYPALESPEYAAALQDLESSLTALEQFALSAAILPSTAPATPADPADLLAAYLTHTNAFLRLYRTITTYTSLHVSVDSYNTTARRRLSELEHTGVRLQKLSSAFQAWLSAHAAQLPGAIAAGGEPAAHAFYLHETLEQSRYLMSQPEEDLVAELNPSAASAWGKLQGTVVSQLSVPFELEGSPQTLPITALINLRSHPQRLVRRRAYEAEQLAWASVAEPLAAAINGVKGSAHVLNLRRGRRDDLHPALDQARIDPATLEAMLSAIRQAFPTFRAYLRAKAAHYGDISLPWWDLFAPSGRLERRFTFAQAQHFITEQFQRFSPELSAFAQHAFQHHWIDAEPRRGKRAGAFCASLPLVEESRIMANFDNSLDGLFTLSHELGHAFHNRCMTGLPPLRRITPMTLAETASTFCETIVTDAALSQAAGPQEEIAILETFLIGATQTCVDITARFLFEQRLFERRAHSELSVAELCSLMQQAQQETYGDGLDPRYLHPYMWTWKPHYYSPGLHFYNFPYAFGLLFGLGLYARYQQMGAAAFLPQYKALLAATGEAAPADLAARFGIDIRTPAFWQSSLNVIARRIQRYQELQ